MSKYIIELNEDCKIVQQMCVTEHGNAYTDGCYSCDLEELNSDYINEHYGELQDEAYQRGHDDGYKKCLSENDFDQPCVSCNDYQAGMDKAWQLAEDVIYNRGNVLDILNCATVGAAFDKYSAGQALDILKAYEHKHSDRIKVGDIVDVYGNLGVVTYTHENGFNVMMYDGSVGYWKQEDLKKTGKHYDIQSILEAMRE